MTKRASVYELNGVEKRPMRRPLTAEEAEERWADVGEVLEAFARRIAAEDAAAAAQEETP